MPSDPDPMVSDALTLRPIGRLRTPFRQLDACPRNPRQIAPAPPCQAEILPDFVAGLRSLEGFSHLILLYWLHRGRPATLQFTPPFDTETRGVFATRAPWRPNPIGLAVVVFDGFAAPDRLNLRQLDCIDSTPLLDIKPYLPSIDAEPAASFGWLAPHLSR